MILKPPRTKGLVIGILLLVILSAAITTSVIQLASETVTPFLGIWTSLVVIGLPLIALNIYRIYGLITAQYILDRDGVYVRWGLSRVQIPLGKIKDVVPQNEITPRLSKRFGFWWPGCVVGKSQSKSHGSIDFFATSTARGNIVIALENRKIVISPPDVQAFIRTFADTVQMGSLEEIPELSEHPDFFSARLWEDRSARLTILGGLSTILILLAFLALRVPNLPSMVPFGFDRAGVPDIFVPPARLLLLPLVGGVFWLVDLILGSWLYRQEGNRPIAYLVWGVGVLMGGILWIAVINLITTS